LIEIAGGAVTEMAGELIAMDGGETAIEGVSTDMDRALFKAKVGTEAALLTEMDGTVGPPPTCIEGTVKAGAGGGLARSPPLSGTVIDGRGRSFFPKL